MAGNADTLYRQWVLLQTIPAYPRSITVREIYERLSSDFDTTVRSIQRDLLMLSTKFGIYEEERGRTKHWSWASDAKALTIPGMTPTQALAWSIADSLLQKLAPQGRLEEIQPFLDRAKGVLETESMRRTRRWSDRVAIMHPGMPLRPPSIAPSVRGIVHQAVFDGMQLSVAYKARGRKKASQMRLHPLGLVFRDGVEYLIATVNDYSDPRQLVLHRIMSVQALTDSIVEPEGFDFKAYIQESFAYLESTNELKVRLSIDPYVAEHLFERPLSQDQEIEEVSEDEVIVEASVADSWELRRWIRGLGSAVEVLEPQSLREEIAGELLETVSYYSADS